MGAGVGEILQDACAAAAPATFAVDVALYTRKAERLARAPRIRGAVKGGEVEAGSVTGGEVEAGAVTGVEVEAGSVTGVEVEAGAVTGVEVEAGAEVDAGSTRGHTLEHDESPQQE